MIQAHIFSVTLTMKTTAQQGTHSSVVYICYIQVVRYLIINGVMSVNSIVLMDISGLFYTSHKKDTKIIIYGHTTMSTSYPQFT